METLYRSNPWWQGEPAPDVPRTRRRLVGQVRRRLEYGNTPIVAAPGPLGVGKTTMQLQIIRDLLDEGVPPRHIIRIQFDELHGADEMADPILHMTRWLERNVTPATFNALAQQGQPAYLFLDEVQKIHNWSNQLKFLVDTTTVRVVGTGSSALRIEQGRDSLAGRMSTVRAGVLSLTEIAEFRSITSPRHFALEESFGRFCRREFWQELAEHGRNNAAARDRAFRLFSECGGYPTTHDPSQLTLMGFHNFVRPDNWYNVPMGKRELTSADTGGRDRLFYLEYKQFKLIGGGRPAFILAVGAPLTIVACAALLLGSETPWVTIAIVIASLVIYAALAGIWVWKETQRSD